MIVDSLTTELEGRIERRFGRPGTTVTLVFPQFMSDGTQLEFAPEAQIVSISNTSTLSS